MRMLFWSSDRKEKIIFEGSKTMFWNTLDHEEWQKFLMEFQKVERDVDVKEFKAEPWNIVV